MSDDVELDYDFMMQRALRYLMRDVLELIADVGDAPGEHHFYIEFLTGAPDVSIPDFLLEDYPERMTIVLQHQFQELTVDERGFSVSLWFKGKEAHLVIPFDAVTSFADPSVQFGLRFERVANAEKDAAPEADENEEAASEGKTPSAAPGKARAVVRIRVCRGHSSRQSSDSRSASFAKAELRRGVAAGWPNTSPF